MDDAQVRENRRIARSWKKAWGNPVFRKKAIVATVIFFAILMSLPAFFGMIERREGPVLNDWLLSRIPSFDVSIPTLIIIWTTTLLILFRCVQDPQIFLVFTCSLIISFFSRMLSITVFPLNPPAGLIPLRDPILNFFYGGQHTFITKDLFYSGHTSIQFLMFLSLRKKSDKIFSFITTLAIAAFVLIQHIHYTIDVLAAFLFTWLIYLLGRKIAGVEKMATDYAD